MTVPIIDVLARIKKVNRASLTDLKKFQTRLFVSIPMMIVR